jgi:rubrerythrin
MEDQKIDPQILANRVSIASGEERVKSYKDLLTEVFKNKDIYPEWYKDLLREMKNYEEKRLKELREENEYLKAGMNPPMKNIPTGKLKTVDLSQYLCLLHYKCATCGNTCLSNERPDNSICGGCDKPDWKLMKHQESYMVNGKDYEHPLGEI